MNNEDQDDSLLDWELALHAAAAADPTPSRASDRNDNAPVFASRNDAFPNPPGDGGDFHKEAPGVPLPNLGTMLFDSDNGLDLRRSTSLGNDEMEKDKKEETADYCRLKRARSVKGHNMSEKRRRKRIRERLMALQALILNSNKDTASMLDDAVRYIKLLRLQVETMSISYGYGGAPNLVQFEGGGGGGDAYRGGGRPILPRGCIPSPHIMSSCCYPPTMMSGFVPNLPPPMPIFPCLFNPRHAQFSWPPAPPAATDYSDVPLIPSTFNDNIGECSHSAPEESPSHHGRR